MSFDHAKVEEAARKKWAELHLYECDLHESAKEPYYLLVEFPYPSGDLHIGHWYAFAVTDIYARMLRARGKNVLFPIGFDAFGLPAENAAIRNRVDPAAWTMGNIERMKAQLARMGASFDWSKEIIAADPSYYHWTQWLFSKLFEHGLAERREAPVKWCPKDQTVLANEQVIDGRCERCGTEVEEKVLTQWFLKITQYADRLLKNLDTLPWREEIKEAQRAWIGKSEGAYIDFTIVGHKEKVRIFTTRPDTLYGATYLVLAPEHPLLSQDFQEKTPTNQSEVRAYIEHAKKKTERERSENKEKTGVELQGIRVVNPVTKEETPVFVADYVLGSYGTGAVMAVPAHDERDYEFAKKYGLPIRFVIDPVTGTPQHYPEHKEKIVALVEDENGSILSIDWGPQLGGRLLIGGTVEAGEDVVAAAKREIAEETGYTDLSLVEQAGERVHHEYFAHSKAKAFVAHTTLLRFMLASDTQQPHAREEHETFKTGWISKEQAEKEIVEPLHRYALDRFLMPRPYTGQGLLVNSGAFDGRESDEAKWAIVEAAGGERTTQYRLRDWLVSRQRYWGCPIPIVYDPEGKPHTIPAEHLPWLLPTDVDFTPTGKAPLASSKELKERVTHIFGSGWTPEYDTLDTFVDSSWYFTRYLDPKDTDQFSNMAIMQKWLPVDRYSGGAEHTTLHLLYSRFFTMALHDLDLVPVEEPYGERYNRGSILGPDGQKMSKSKGNVINPDKWVDKYGADAVRVYLAFIGPYNEPGSYPWQLDGVASMRKFLDRVGRVVEKAGDGESSETLQRALALAAKKIAEDGDRFKFNTSIAALMSLLNELEKTETIPIQAARGLVVMLAPFAPHLADYLWEKFGGEGSVHTQPWPTYDPALLVEAKVTIVVQVAGKKRGEVTLAPDASEAGALEAALALAPVTAALNGAQPSRTIYVPGRILNLMP